MSTEYFEGIHWRHGLPKNINNQGIDETCWLCNESKSYSVKDSSVQLYLLRDINNDNIFKIGISYAVKSRIYGLNKDIKFLGFNHNFKLVDKVFVGEREHALFYEDFLLKQFNNKCYKRSIFNGATELFQSDFDTIIKTFNKVKTYIQTHKLI